MDKLVDLPEHEIRALQKQSKPVSAALLNQFFDFLFGQEATIRFASQPKLALEMTFMRLFQIQPPLPIDDLIDKLDGLRQEIAGNIIASEDRVSGSESPDSAKMSRKVRIIWKTFGMRFTSVYPKRILPWLPI
jgi:DNA polymerase-3 subunit gamma/tau